jgi:hypothetical protein
MAMKKVVVLTFVVLFCTATAWATYLPATADPKPPCGQAGMACQQDCVKAKADPGDDPPPRRIRLREAGEGGQIRIEVMADDEDDPPCEKACGQSCSKGDPEDWGKARGKMTGKVRIERFEVDGRKARGWGEDRGGACDKQCMKECEQACLKACKKALGKECDKEAVKRCAKACAKACLKACKKACDQPGDRACGPMCPMHADGGKPCAPEKCGMGPCSEMKRNPRGPACEGPRCEKRCDGECRGRAKCEMGPCRGDGRGGDGKCPGDCMKERCRGESCPMVRGGEQGFECRGRGKCGIGHRGQAWGRCDGQCEREYRGWRERGWRDGGRCGERCRWHGRGFERPCSGDCRGQRCDGRCDGECRGPNKCGERSWRGRGWSQERGMERGRWGGGFRGGRGWGWDR